MKKLIVLGLAIMVALALSVPAFAVGPGKTVVLDDGTMGKVTFSGDAHKSLKCNDCHPALFKMKKGADKITMKEINAGKSCGTCHNGTKAFAAKDCKKCHKKE